MPLAGDGVSPSTHGSSPVVSGPALAVQRAVERPAITLNSGVKWERLMSWADEDVEFIEATYAPGGASSPDDSFVRHHGHEFGHVLSGTLRVVVGFDEFVLEAGDSITFPSGTPHRLSNEGTETVRAIWVVRGRRGAETGHEPTDTTSTTSAARRVKGARPAHTRVTPVAGKRKR
jgi:mannose-6-phosphate isomerase-like protein (cupin superfamily)